MILYGANEDVSKWASSMIFGVDDMFEGSKAIGIVENNKLIAGVIYNNFRQTPMEEIYSCEMSIASVDKKWCNRHNLRVLFEYPFTQLCLRRVQTTCADEGTIMKFNERLGFKKEGTHRGAWPLGGDAISWGMLKNECRWING